MPLTAGVYVRVSDVPKGQTLDNQEQACRKLAEARGWAVTLYSDKVASAWKRRKDANGVRYTVRPVWQQMMADAAAGEIGAVIVYKLDRFTRQPRELEDLIDLAEGGRVQVVAVDGIYDLATGASCTMARVQVTLANQASRDTSDRVCFALAACAVTGGRHGGMRPYGWLPNRRADAHHVAGLVEIDEREAEVIREVRDRLLAGESVRGVCRVLNQRGDLTATGKPWGTTPLRNLMLSRRLIGQREHKGKVADATWPAIISPVDQSRLRIVLAGKAGASTSPRYLLSGVLTCGVCRAKLVHNPASTRNKAAYVCPPPPRGNWCVAVQAERAEQHLTEVALSIGDTTLAPVATPPVDTRADDARALADLAAKWAAGRVTLADLAQGKADIEARRADAIAERTPPHWLTLSDVRSMWHTLTPDAKALEVRRILGPVLVDKDTRPKGQRIVDPVAFAARFRFPEYGDSDRPRNRLWLRQLTRVY
jgi:site-specific DNA recombinase